MVVVGILLVAVIVWIIKYLWAFDTGKTKRVLLHLSMMAVSILYIVCCFALHIEPFDYVVNDFTDFFIDTAVIFICSPCLWFVVFYYCNAVFKKMRVRKNAKLKTKEQYAYYRDDLNKIDPGILMFTYKMNTDVRKSISATILKLKLDGYIADVNNELQYTGKNPADLTNPEKVVLNSIKNNTFDEHQYKKLVEKEALDNKFLKKNTKGMVLKLVKMLLTIVFPFLLIFASEQFDTYVFHTYEIYDLDNVRYLKIRDEDEIDHLYNEEVKDQNDYYHSYYEDGDRWCYNYGLIRADKFQYSSVRKMLLFNILDCLLILTSIVMVCVALVMLLLQIRYFNKDYKRTIKGNELINKAYALKNYLTEYSLIKDRTEQELILWEYYLVYAVALDVNVIIEDEIIEKYLRSIHY